MERRKKKRELVSSARITNASFERDERENREREREIKRVARAAKEPTRSICMRERESLESWSKLLWPTITSLFQKNAQPSEQQIRKFAKSKSVL